VKAIYLYDKQFAYRPVIEHLISFMEIPSRNTTPRSYFLKTALCRPTDHKFMFFRITDLNKSAKFTEC